MDQTPLLFVLDNGKMYTMMAEEEIWTAIWQSGLDKQQCIVQLTIFAVGVNRVCPLVIFRGKALQIAKTEGESYDRRMNVLFQPNAWCDK